MLMKPTSVEKGVYALFIPGRMSQDDTQPYTRSANLEISRFLIIDTEFFWL
jgi:hypothetical protein